MFASTDKGYLTEVIHIMADNPIDIVHHQPCGKLIPGRGHVTAHIVVLAYVRPLVVERRVAFEVYHIYIVEYIGHRADYVVVSGAWHVVARSGDNKYLGFRLYTLDTLYNPAIVTGKCIGVLGVVTGYDIGLYIAHGVATGTVVDT